MSLNFAERLLGFTGSGYRNYEQAMELMREFPYRLYVSPNMESILRPTSGNDCKPLLVYKRAASKMIKNLDIIPVAQIGCAVVYQVNPIR